VLRKKEKTVQLTNEQLQAAEQGPVTVEAGGKQFVVIAKQLYDRVKWAFDYDDGDLDPRETYPAALSAWGGSPEDDTLYADIEPEA
jgi:hypothetical protein